MACCNKCYKTKNLICIIDVKLGLLEVESVMEYLAHAVTKYFHKFLPRYDKSCHNESFTKFIMDVVARHLFF